MYDQRRTGEGDPGRSHAMGLDIGHCTGSWPKEMTPSEGSKEDRRRSWPKEMTPDV